MFVFSSFSLLSPVKRKAEENVRRDNEASSGHFPWPHLGMNKMRSAKTNPTVTSRLLAGNTKGNTNNMNPNTIGT